MNSKITKKVLGVVLVVALIVTQALVAIPAQADTPEMKLTQTFETATGIGQSWETGKIGATAASVSGQSDPVLSIAENVDGHSKALRVNKTTKSADFKQRVAIGNDTGAGLGNVTENQKYNVIIGFDYKVDSTSDTVWGPKLQQFYFGRDALATNISLSGVADKSVIFNKGTTSVTSPGTNYSEYKGFDDGKWHTMSFAVQITAKQDVTNGNTRFGFAFDIGQTVTCDIYLDNISVQIVSQGATFCLHPDNGEELDITSGVVGSALNIKTPQKNGSIFDGWYTDSGLTTPYGSTVTANTTSWGTKENAITHLYAKWTKLYDEMVQNFDSATTIGGDWDSGPILASNKTNLSIVAEEGRGNVLKVNKSTTSGKWDTGIRIARDNANYPSLGRVETGEMYNLIVTFDYKIDDTKGGDYAPAMDRTFIRYTPNQYWSNGAPVTNPVNFGPNTSAETPDTKSSSYKAIADGNWHTMSFATTSKAVDASSNGLFGFSLVVNDGYKLVAYFDNFNIKKLNTGYAGATVNLHSNGGTIYDISAGIVGQPMNLPTPTKKNSEFLGWYSDAACTIPAGNTYVANTETFGTKANAITNYYAKWNFTGSNYVETFEGYDNTSIANNVTSNSYQNASTGTVNNVVTVESDVDGHSKALRFNKPSSSADNYYPWIVAKASEGLGGVVAGNAYNVILKFDYKTNSVTGNEYGFNLENFAFCNGTVSANDYQSSNKAFQFLKNNTTANTVGLYNEFTAIADNEWHTVSLAMQVTAKNTLSDAFLSFKVNTGTRSVIDFYLDNIDVSILGDGEVGSTVALVSNGGTEYDYFAGVVGQPLTLPDDIECDDHEFRGWYTDSDLLNEVGENPVFTANTDSWGAKTNAVTKYYAKWYVDDGYKSLDETFEEASTADISYRFTDDISNMHGTPTIEEENNNKYFKYTYNSNSEKFITPFIVFDENDTEGYSLNQYIRSGSTYKVLIDYKYKIDKTYGEGIWLTPAFIDMDGGSIVSTKVGGKFIKLGKSSYAYDDNAALGVNDGTWRQASIVVELKATASTFAGFGFNFDAAKNDLTVCLDDISVEVLEPGSGYYNLSVDTTGTSYKIDNTTGQYGDVISLTLPTNMYKKGAKFIGFKDQNGVAYSNSRTFDSEDLTFSAEFEYNKKVYDFNFDDSINLLDLVKLKKLFANDTDFTETVENPSDLLAELRKTLLNVDLTKTLGSNTYTLAWNDEFNGNSLDTASWAKKSSNSGIYSYDAVNQRVNVACDDASLVSVSDGNLRLGYSRVSANNTVNVYKNANNEYVYNPADLTGLTLVKANAPVYYANASGVISNVTYKYGYIESRMKLPGGNFGASLWLNNTSSKLLNNEVDLFETLNSMNIKSNIHTWDPTNWKGEQINYHRDWHSQGIIGDERMAAENYDASCYHTFGFEWTPNCVKFYYNGNAYLTLTPDDLAGTAYENDFDGFVNEALRMNIDGVLYNNNTNESTTEYLVDYVRIYQNASADNELVAY